MSDQGAASIRPHATAPLTGRRPYLDWLRGIAVLIMIEAHVLDSWTVAGDRQRLAYTLAITLGGFGAPIFLLLAGVSQALAAGARRRRGLADDAIARQASRRAWQIFGLAFLFRLQSVVVSAGTLASMLKVDILNVMGLSLLVSALTWRVLPTPRARAAALAGLAVAVAMATPLVRAATPLALLPDPLEWYLRSPAGEVTFTLFPWAGFVLAGAAVGIWLDGSRTFAAERRIQMQLVLAGVVVFGLGFGASLLPPIYRETSFWTSSPTFFFVRVGIIVAAIPLAYAWGLRRRERSWIHVVGVASLFIYWIHVELVYGLVSLPLHQALTLGQAAGACLVLVVLLHRLVLLRDRMIAAHGGSTSAALSSVLPEVLSRRILVKQWAAGRASGTESG